MGRSTRRDAQEYMPKSFRVGPFVVLVIVAGAIAGVLVAGVPDVSGSSETAGEMAGGVMSTETTDLAAPTTEASSTTTAMSTTTTSAPMSTTSTTTTSTSTTSTSTTVPAGTIDLRVVIANGTDEAGLATRVSDKLSGRGYTDTHATDTASPAEATVIYYAPGLKDDAAAVAGVLELWAALEPMPAADPTADGSGVAADLLIVFG